MKPIRLSGLHLAKRRARLRGRSAGAAIFIVAMTLALLAVMGVYGLSATTKEVKSVGHMREATQARYAGELAAMGAAETFTPGTSAELVRAMRNSAKYSSNCKSAVGGALQVRTQNAQACLSWSELEMSNISKMTNQFTSSGTPLPAGCSLNTDCPFFTDDSFGHIPQRAFLRVEVTNPVDVPPRAGSGLDGKFVFTQVTTTVYVDMKPVRDAPSDSTVVARGRMTVGPYFQ